MIVDLEGGTFEPSRRRHVAMLSASVAAVSMVLLYVLVVPAPRVDTQPLAASSAPSPTDGTVVFFASDPTWIPSHRWSPLVSVGPSPDGETWTECAAGIGSSPPVTLVFDREGRRLIAAYTTGKTGRFIPLPTAYLDSGWLIVPCDTSDVFAPRIDRGR